MHTPTGFVVEVDLPDHSVRIGQAQEPYRQNGSRAERIVMHSDVIASIFDSDDVTIVFHFRETHALLEMRLTHAEEQAQRKVAVHIDLWGDCFRLKVVNGDADPHVHYVRNPDCARSFRSQSSLQAETLELKKGHGESVVRIVMQSKATRAAA